MIKSARPFIGGDYSRHYNGSNLPKVFSLLAAVSLMVADRTLTSDCES